MFGIPSITLALLLLLIVASSGSIAQDYESVAQVLDGHKSPVTDIAFSPDGRILASSEWSHDVNKVRLWDVRTGELLARWKLEYSISSLAFSPDGEILAVGRDQHIDEPALQLWSVKAGKPIFTLLEGSDVVVFSLAFSPDGRILASGFRNRDSANLIKFWDVQTGEELQQTITVPDAEAFINPLAFSPDGKTLVGKSGDNTVRIWDVSTGELLKTLTLERSYNSVFGRGTLAGICDDNIVRVWDVQTGEELQILKAPEMMPGMVSFPSIAISPDGKTLASNVSGNVVRIWDVKTGELLRTLEKHDVRELAFSPDGGILASGDMDKVIRLWDVQTGELRRILYGRIAAVDRVDFPPEAYTAWNPEDELAKLKLSLDIIGAQGRVPDVELWESSIKFAQAFPKLEAGYFAARLSSQVELEDVRLISPDGKMHLVYPESVWVDTGRPGFFFGRFLDKPERVKIQGKINGETFSVTFNGSIRPEDVPSLPQEWAKERIAYLTETMIKHERNDFCVREILRLAGKYGLDAREWKSFSFWRRDDLADIDMLFAVATGAAAIEESLQLETLKQVQESVIADQTIPIAELIGPEIESHPYQEMLGNSSYDMEEIAGLIPFDSMYVRFASADAAYQFLDFMDLWGTDILRVRNLTSEGDRVVRRVEEQLCVEFDRGLKPFIPLVVSDIAVVFGDPYAYESADVSLIFHLKNKTLFESTANGWFEKARSQHRALREEQTAYRGFNIHSLVFDDGKVSSYSSYTGDYVIYSNNMASLKRILDTHSKEYRSIADTWDFKYMRSIFPSRDDDGFVYMGDDFVRKVVGPGDKLKGMRRFTCRDNMIRLKDAMYAFQMENRGDADPSRLFNARFIVPFPACPDGGLYQFTEDGMISCLIHGRLDAMNQLSNLSIEKITPKEKELYENFKRRYHSYFSQYFDPIGIQIKVGERITLRTCILPLIQNSIYRILEVGAGGAPLAFDYVRVFPTDSIAGIFLKLRVFDGYKNDLSHISDEELKTLVLSIKPQIEAAFQWDSQQDIFSWIGNNLMIGFYDISLKSGTRASMVLGTLSASETFIALEIKDRALAQKVVDKVLELILRTNEKATTVVNAEHKGYPIKILKFREDESDLPFGGIVAIGFTESKLILGFSEDVIRKVMDSSVSDSSAGSDTKYRSNFLLHLNLQNAPVLKKSMESYWARVIQGRCQSNRSALDAIVQVFVQGLDIPVGQDLLEKVSSIEKMPYCPEGGEYQYVSEEGVVCSIHGSSLRPKHIVTEGGRIRKLFDGIDQITASLEFTEHGIMTTLSLDNPAYMPGTGGIFKRLWNMNR